jgi:hypothetical protein
MSYGIEYAPQAVEDIRALRAFDRANVVNAIEQHLSHEPEKVSMSRIKRMIQHDSAVLEPLSAPR